MLCTAACVNAIVMNPRQRQRVHKARPAPSNADDAAVFDAKLRRDLASYEAARVISRLEQGDSARRAPLISAQKNALLQRAPSAILAICGVEQLVARRAHNPEVAGSSPVPATSRVGAHSSPRQTHERRVLHEGASFASCAGISRGGPGRPVTACLGVLTAGSPGHPHWPTGWAERPQRTGTQGGHHQRPQRTGTQRCRPQRTGTTQHILQFPSIASCS